MDHVNRAGTTTNVDDAATEPTRGRTWVVSPDGASCAHPADRLTRVGDDGVNTYYQCDECEAVVVSQDELVRATRAVSRRSR